VTALIVDYVTGELDPETTLLFEQHLRDCADCVSFLNTYQGTIRATRSLRYEQIPPELEARVRRVLRQRMKRAVATRRAPR
jgi:anti-sigma factor RsiW